jgi:lytic murein transglycosylase
MGMKRILSGLVGLCVAGMAMAEGIAEVGPRAGGEEQSVEIATQAGLEAWLEGFRLRAGAQGISPQVLEAGLSGLAFAPDIIEKDRNQSEFTKTIWVYLDSAVSPERVANGQAALAAHRGVLERIEARWGVDKEIVAAVWGLESAYGTFRGSVPTLGALATLAYDGRRGAFFEDQLIAALRILQAGDTTPGAMEGSWAGAMGHTQFMPTSYLAHAVDFDGDGRRDIWGDDPADALASTAAYLADAGWIAGQPWGLEVRLPEGFDYGLAGERVKKPAADWAAMGVVPVAGGVLADHGPASVLLPAGAAGAAFVIYQNFHVIERYNTADAYVIAVGHLADRIAGGGPIVAGWPREDRALSYDERIELQRRLIAAGFDTGAVDGRIGPNTIAAVRGFQRQAGLLPDGYANPALLERLR